VTNDGHWFETRYDASIDRLVQSIDENRIDRVVVLPIHPGISNDFIVEISREYSGFISGFCSLNPLMPDAEQVLEHYIQDKGLCGLKLHPKIQGFNLSQLPLDLVERCGDLEIPILIDAWIGQHEVGKSLIIESICTIAGMNPDTTIIIPHLGGYRFFDMPSICESFPNIFFDLSYILLRFARTGGLPDLVTALKMMDPARLIYGSDFPESDIGEYLGIFFYAGNDIGWNKGDLDKIMSGTIKNMIHVN
jgi:predicted TIM-barrel fold metal-dependent hydrolase